MCRIFSTPFPRWCSQSHESASGRINVPCSPWKADLEGLSSDIPANSPLRCHWGVHVASGDPQTQVCQLNPPQAKCQSLNGKREGSAGVCCSRPLPDRLASCRRGQRQDTRSVSIFISVILGQWAISLPLPTSACPSHTPVLFHGVVPRVFFAYQQELPWTGHYISAGCLESHEVLEGRVGSVGWSCALCSAQPSKSGWLSAVRAGGHQHLTQVIEDAAWFLKKLPRTQTQYCWTLPCLQCRTCCTGKIFLGFFLVSLGLVFLFFVFLCYKK